MDVEIGAKTCHMGRWSGSGIRTGLGTRHSGTLAPYFSGFRIITCSVAEPMPR